MKFETLISHSGELLAVALKSRKSTDTLVSEYLRQKKYIGSKERKFISDIVFATIRLLSLSANCIETALKDVLPDESSGDEVSNLSPYYSRVNQYRPFSDSLINSVSIDFDMFAKNWFKLLIISTLILIKDKNSGNPSNITIKHLYLLYGEAFDLDREIIYSIGFFADVNNNQAIKIYERITARFLHLKALSESLSNRIFKDLSSDEKNEFSIYSCMPFCLIEELIHNYKDICFVLKLCDSLKHQASTSIRINQFQKNKEFVGNYLQSIGINVADSQISPSALILERRVQLNVNPLFKQGYFEVQDDGSQLISFALAPDKNAKVLDACAGAGGKTLHIADIQEDSGKILAFDIDFLRLKELKRRAKKYPYHSIETFFIKNGLLPDNFKGTFDYVLVDAPCSGLGTVRRLPLTKWRLTPKILEKHSKKQLKLVNYFSKFLKAGGILVYSTCSFSNKENDEVISNFLDNHPEFSPDSLIPAFSKFGVKVKFETTDTYKITLLPSLYNCDGFFISRLKRMF